MSNIHPLFEQIIKPFVSPALEKPLRSQADVLSARTAALMTGPMWLIFIEPRRGEIYALEMEWNQMSNERSALNRLMDQLSGDDNATILNITEDGRRVDCSEDFAR